MILWLETEDAAGNAEKVITLLESEAILDNDLTNSATVYISEEDCAELGVHGINNGLIPIVAYNYGARNKSRISASVKWGVIYGIALFIAFFMLLELLPVQMLGLFDASKHMIEIGIPAIRILAVAYLISIPSLVFAAALQGLSQGTRSMYITMLRQAILPLAFAFLLSRTGQLQVVWTAFILAELLGIPVAWFLWRKSFNESV